MTENEDTKVNVALIGDGRSAGRALKVIIDLLQELEEYRAIGTIDECKSNKVLSDKRFEYIFDGIDLLEAYKSIGTLEEFTILKEKSIPKKPDEKIKLIGLSKGGKCPTCQKCVNNHNHWPFCECGQKLNWQ